MNTPISNDSKEPVNQDFRQLFAQKERRVGRSPIRLLRACFRSCNAGTAELLEGGIVLSLAGCLCLIFAGVSVFLIQKANGNRKLSADLTTSSRMEPSLPSQGPMGLVSDVKTFAEDRIEPDRPSNSLTSDSTFGTREAFIIRVGSFRNASNAKRVAESLREQMLNVKTEVRAGGLHVVIMGPFPQKEAAEDAARSVRERSGLAPQVLQLHFE